MGELAEGVEVMDFLKDEVVQEGRFLRKINRYFLDKNGKKLVWEMVERKGVAKNRRIIAIAAITADKEIILNKIFRVPLWDFVLELPAGLIEREDESEEEAVRRELLEETGYEVDKIELILTGPFDTGILKDKIAVFLGTNAKFVQAPKLESTEDIRVVNIPIKNLLYFITQNQGKMNIEVKISAVIPYLQAKGIF